MTEADSVQDILEFLDTAPPSVKNWAAAQRKLLEEEPPSTTLIDQVEEGGEDEAFYQGLGDNDDDIVYQKRVKRRQRKSGAPTREGLPYLGWVALLCAVIAGMSLSLWIGGVGSAHPDVEVPAGMADSDDAMMEELLEAKFLVEQNPDDIGMRIRLADMQTAVGFTDDAIEQLEKVTELDPLSVEAWYRLGFLYAPNDPKLGASAWQKVIDIAPDTDEAAKARTHLDGLQQASQSEEG